LGQGGFCRGFCPHPPAQPHPSAPLAPAVPPPLAMHIETQRRQCASPALPALNHCDDCLAAINVAPAHAQLLFRTINRELGHPNANDDYIAPMFR